MSLKSLTSKDLIQFVNTRKGEQKLGENIHTLAYGDLNELDTLKENGARFCLLGIPESIGVRGNLGNQGTELAWPAFLTSFLNVQGNRFLSGDSFVVLGQVDVEDLRDELTLFNSTPAEVAQKARKLCEAVDERVTPIISSVIKAGLIPIVIGGGHNNAYPLLKGVAKALNTTAGINAINLDAHADFRSLEGRHSGNGFSYAKNEGFLNRYFAFGLHQSYNSENILSAMDQDRDVAYSFFEDISNFDVALKEALAFVDDKETPVGIELDMDAIKSMPSSAISPSGVTLEQARAYVRECASQLNVAYLHLPEAAPSNSAENGFVGKALSYLVTDFAKSSL
ncbi:formimidoylglutamase [Roseivirga sp.]|uniref:formimidoylglutamase n=1 Tax=Roseivirga sp. TaxID=1964215 RepID=UPI003B8AB1D8